MSALKKKQRKELPRYTKNLSFLFDDFSVYSKVEFTLRKF